MGEVFEEIGDGSRRLWLLKWCGAVLSKLDHSAYSSFFTSSSAGDDRSGMTGTTAVITRPALVCCVKRIYIFQTKKKKNRNRLHADKTEHSALDFGSFIASIHLNKRRRQFLIQRRDYRKGENDEWKLDD